MSKLSLPKHVAIIMDGNRRWARQHQLQLFQGHEKVAREGIEKLVDYCLEVGIPYLTLWAFSTENWNREEKEVSHILNLMRDLFDTSSAALEKKGVRINTIGDLSRFPADIRDRIKYWQERTKERTKMTVTFGLNYGGRDEIARATQKMILAHQAELQTTADWAPFLAKVRQEEFFRQYLDTVDLPDPDLIIRPGGEKRLSGYLSWQATYAELYFTEVLMPDFDQQQLALAINDFSQRQRRFGK